MTWFALFWALTLGVEQSNLLDTYPPEWFGYTELAVSAVAWDALEVGGSVRTVIVPARVPYFSPVEAGFIFFIRIFYGPLSFNFEHQCLHNFPGYHTIDGLGYNRFFVTIGSQR